MRWISSAPAALAAFLVAALPASAEEWAVRVTSATVNVRSGPGTGYKIIGHVTEGQKYVKINSSGAWRKIWYDQRTGWVHSDHLVRAADSARERRVTATALNVRTGPGTRYDIVGTAPHNSWWVVVDASGDWRKIFYRGHARYVHGDYLSAKDAPSDGGSLPRSSIGFVQMPASGAGFYSYTSSYRRWGTPAMVYGLIRASRSWAADHNWPRLGMGDISLATGGYFPPHVSHRYGKDADIRPVASTVYEGPLTRFSSIYSRYRTSDWMHRHLRRELSVSLILFNDTAIPGVMYYSGHDNHMHVRIH